MERIEAEAKLKHYHADYGDWVYTTNPQAARQRAVEYRNDAMDIALDNQSERRLKLLVKAVHYDAVADCLETLGENVPAAPGEPYPENVCSLIDFKERKASEPLDIEFVGEGESFEREGADPDEYYEDDEPEIFTLMQLRHCAKPRFAIGDPAWIADYGDVEVKPGDPEPPVVGYVPVTIVGMELYPDEILYMFGEYDQEDGEVLTNFETLPDEAFFVEPPDIKPVRPRPQLSIVR
ncbi:hypothetical protein LUCX_191 [Xanthomonas phage vB_XciM_LucasX]|nr:hypothetical protein LUCX_191 [Xanthomonas phage vB_XciM_LucasX]